MASPTLGLTLNWAPFPLIKEVLTEESTFVEISTKVQVGGQGNNIQWEKRTAKIRKIDHLNKELMMNSIIEFEDACAAGCLNLSIGEKIYSRFRELLGEVFRADWDNAHQGKANSVAGFHETLNEFISYHFSNTDLIDQKNMLTKAKKPFKYTVKVLCSSLRHLNKLMSKLPGANNMLPYNKGALKIKLFKMMLSNWQFNYNKAGLNITDNAYMLQRLVRFMTVQEASFNAVQEHKRSATTLPARRSPACPGGGRVTFQQGHHGGQGGRFGGWGSPEHAAGCSASGSAGGNCPFHPGIHNWEMCFANPHGLNFWPRFRPIVPEGAARGGRGNRAGGRGQPRGNQDVHFAENPVEAEEHGYKEEPTLQIDMDPKAKGHSGEPSQEEQHWLENYNLDDQE
jgi:hypothetical protein